MDLPRNAFRHAIAEGRMQYGAWLMSAAPSTAEALGSTGFDFLVVDMEHVPIDTPQLVEILRTIAGTPASPVTRLPWNDTVMVKRALDAGAQTLMFPFVQDAAEAARAVAATRYPPAGVRGAAAVHRASRYGNVPDYLGRAADEICVVVQVETVDAVDRMAEIAAVPGVDSVFVCSWGPATSPHRWGTSATSVTPTSRRSSRVPAPRLGASASPAGSSAATPRWRDASSTTATRGSPSAPT